MHLVEILEETFPTYHVRDAEEIKSPTKIRHFNQWDKEIKTTADWLPQHKEPVDIAITSGASCPDILVDEVILKILSYFEGTESIESIIEPFVKKLDEVA
jgi:4-hydroxy-3-methylbut-2-enyl diphosphate reductase